MQEGAEASCFAKLLGVGKQRQSWLKESLRTKDLR
jgi:hypothetical protein